MRNRHGLFLYAATIPSYQQILGAISGLLTTAENFCSEKGISPEEIIQARLTADMEPFAYQVKSTVVHSLGAIEGVRRGAFSPDTTTPPASFAALKARISEALAALEAIQPAEIEDFVGRDMRFVAGERQLPFTARIFSFLLPTELLLSCDYGVRHSALERSTDWEAKFRR